MGETIHATLKRICLHQAALLLADSDKSIAAIARDVGYSGNGVHIAFMATSRGQAHAFYEAALAAGGTGDGEPGKRPHYGEPYYGCFVRDLDGQKIEAMAWLEDESA